jgi:hypothetical protein
MTDPTRDLTQTARPTLTAHGVTSGRTIDGDTFVASGDLDALVPGAKPWTPHVRVAGVDTPERTEPGWGEARDAASAWLGRGTFDLEVFGRDKYGRLLAAPHREGDYLSATLLKLPGVVPLSLRAQLEGPVPHADPLLSYPGRIRAGYVEPWVPPDVNGVPAELARRSAAVAGDELATMAEDDPRREWVAEQQAAWLDRARELEDRERARTREG